MHNQFIELKGQLVLGRGEEITTVMNYVQHGTISDGSGSGRLPPLIVLGSSGSGKSALMANCTLEIKKKRNSRCSFTLLGHVLDQRYL